jgi:hypothetical protein
MYPEGTDCIFCSRCSRFIFTLCPPSIHLNVLAAVSKLTKGTAAVPSAAVLEVSTWVK